MKSFRDVLNGRMRTGKGRFVLASLVQGVEERFFLTKSEIIFTARFPRIRTTGYIRGINSAKISGYKKDGGLRFNVGSC